MAMGALLSWDIATETFSIKTYRFVFSVVFYERLDQNRIEISDNFFVVLKLTNSLQDATLSVNSTSCGFNCRVISGASSMI